MELEVLKRYIEEHIPGDCVQINGDGRHFDAIIVSSAFENLNTLKRQQQVYAFLSEKIASGELHAFTMKTYTPVEWQQQEKKNG